MKKDRHSHKQGHRHSHEFVDPAILGSQKGIRCIKWSFIILMITAIIQIVVVYFTGSVALLADTVHNFGDALTAIPLGFAFYASKKEPSNRFTYGLGRFEDFAGIFIILMILFSGLYAGYESILRIINPKDVIFLPAIIAASLIGFLGNEVVARFRIRVGTEIGSAALIADGYHARVDGFTSLAVLLGAAGIWFGFPIADPVVGICISLIILKIVWDLSKTIFTRSLDGVDPDLIGDMRSVVRKVPGVIKTSEIRARWIGHRLHAEINISVKPELTVEQGHEIGKDVEHELIHKIEHLSSATVHVDPEHANGENFHFSKKHPH